MGFLNNIWSHLPAISKVFNTYSAITCFLIGILLGALVGRFSMIVIIMAIAGIISSHSKLSIHGFNTAYIIPNLTFLVGVILTTTKATPFLLAFVYITGLILGKVTKQEFHRS
ncbi:MAG: hypothetical protein ACOCZV_00640 [Nanoarchaeota archaeon]